MIFPGWGRKVVAGLGFAGALLMGGLWWWQTADEQSRVEGLSDREEENPGVLQPVVGKLEYRPRADLVSEDGRVDGELNGETVFALTDNGEVVGRAIREYSDGRLTIDAAVKLPTVAEDKFYEVWLVMREPARAYFSLGVLAAADDGYGLRYGNGQDMPQYDGLVVTEELKANGRDGIPERLVAEGVFGNGH